MKDIKRPLEFLASMVLALGLVAPMFAAEETKRTLTDLQVSFKLDPRLTKSLYMGDRWVSPPTYTGTSGQDTVEARAQGLDSEGRSVSISPQWIAADPEMVTVSPSQGSEVKITLKRAGESRLQVISQGVTKELSIKAAVRNNLLEVQIAQSEVVQPPAAQTVAATGPAAASPARNASAFKSDKERVSYALGMNYGSALRKTPVEMDPDLLIKGLRDALSSRPTLLTDKEMQATLASLKGELKKERTASQATRNNELAEKNKQTEEAFLAENKARDGVVTLDSGLQYRILKSADGRKPAAGDTVIAHYRGTLLDGTEFDSSHKRKKPATVALPRAIPGWREALQLMPVGSKWQLFIPSNLAFGAQPGRRHPGIAPNATLVFEVELISIREKPGASAQVNDRVNEVGSGLQASAR